MNGFRVSARVKWRTWIGNGKRSCAIASAIPEIPELGDETLTNNLLRSAKCGVYKTGIRAAKMEIPNNPRNSISAASYGSNGLWFLRIL
jgi:hypothetical protein